MENCTSLAFAESDIGMKRGDVLLSYGWIWPANYNDGFWNFSFPRFRDVTHSAKIHNWKKEPLLNLLDFTFYKWFFKRHVQSKWWSCCWYMVCFASFPIPWLATHNLVFQVDCRPTRKHRRLKRMDSGSRMPEREWDREKVCTCDDWWGTGNRWIC